MKYSQAAEKVDANERTHRYQVECAVVLENAMYIDFEIVLDSDDLEECLAHARRLASGRDYEHAVVVVWDNTTRDFVSTRYPLTVT